MRLALAILGMLCGCDGISSHPSIPDGPSETDAPPDAAVYVRHYVLDSVRFPTTLAEARAWSVDFTGDSLPDNPLGELLVTLSQFGLAAQLHSQDAVDEGRVLLLAEMTSLSEAYVDGPTTFTMFVGANPVPAACDSQTCRHHLDGSGAFDVSATSPRDIPLRGTLAGSTMLADSGKLGVVIELGEIAVELSLIGARVQIVTTTRYGASGLIMGGITKAQLDEGVIPALSIAIDSQVAADCQGGFDCGCVLLSSGRSLRQMFDTNNDCHVTVSELRADSDIRKVIWTDAVVDGTDVTPFAFRFTAAPATFTP